MSNKTNNSQERRKFLKDSGRLIIFGTLAAISSLSLKKTDDRPEDSCPAMVFCGDCRSADSCNLPGAREHRSKTE